MATFLFNEIIFGPVQSRRLGSSLGINLLPLQTKFCNFNCLYCECGWTCDNETASTQIPPRGEVQRLLELKLTDMAAEGQLPDTITFAGNGEPTLHPNFSEIIQDTIQLRNSIAPRAMIAVLSNATTVYQPRIREALLSIGRPILKLDTAIESTYRLLNQPLSKRSVGQIIEDLRKFEKPVILQTLFLRGSYRDQFMDNTTEAELEALIKAYHLIGPESIMIYTFARDTPLDSLDKIDAGTLNSIAGRLKKEGFVAEVSA